MTPTSAAWRAGVATDPGQVRSNNEDRAHADPASGFFLVVDGMGGHAAGELAADMAADVIPRVYDSARGSTESRVRQAIAAANNEIFQIAERRPDCAGMACVVALAIASEDQLAIAHVGDSRVYIATAGQLRKVTSDHSPVGEGEARGELTEEEALRDPRRNQVFRDVGSHPHAPDDEEFIEFRLLPLRADTAILLCTDGLSDALDTAGINHVVQRYAGDPQRTAQDLVDAANAAGGRDNITVIFVVGPAFQTAEPPVLAETRVRHSITRPRKNHNAALAALGRLAWLIVGAAIGIGAFIGYERTHGSLNRGSVAATQAVPGHWKADPGDPESLRAIVASARPGDVVDLGKGVWSGPVELKDGVDVSATVPGTPVVKAGPSGLALIARDVASAHVSGVRFEGRVDLVNSSPTLDEVEITGSRTCGISLEGRSSPVIRASYIHDNAGCAISVEASGAPRLVGDRFGANGVLFLGPEPRDFSLRNIVDLPVPAAGSAK